MSILDLLFECFLRFKCFATKKHQGPRMLLLNAADFALNSLQRTKTWEGKSFGQNLNRAEKLQNPQKLPRFLFGLLQMQKVWPFQYQIWEIVILNLEFWQLWISKVLNFVSISNISPAVWGLLIAFVTSVPSFDELSLLMHMNRNLYQWYITMFMLPYKAPTLKYPFTPKMSKQIF